MEMKINFDQLFNTGGLQELNTTIQSPSIETSHQISSSLNNSLQYKYHFNNKFFDSQQFDQKHEVQFDQQYSEIQIASKSTKSIKKLINNIGNKSQKPGQRLFYQSQQNEQKKLKQRQKIQQQKLQQLNKIVTFIPTINKNSRKMAQRLKQQPKLKTIKSKNNIKSTQQLKQQQIKKQCTFQPKLISKNKNINKSKQQLFYNLYNTSKIKDIKLQKLIQQQYHQYNHKKYHQQDFNNFLKRNDQYTALIKKKQQIMKMNSEKYDLKTGDKLFSPKLTDNKPHYFHSTTSFKQINTSNNKKQHKIHNKNQQTQPHLKQPTIKSNQLPKSKSSIFNKKYNFDDKIGQQIKNLRQQKIQNINHYQQQQIQQKQQQFEQSYKNYCQQYDRISAQNQSKSQHQVIPQQQQISANDQKIYSKQSYNSIKQDQIQVQQMNMWGSNQIKPFQLSNVNQYLNASDQDQHQHKSNYVMDILNNLMIKNDDSQIRQ